MFAVGIRDLATLNDLDLFVSASGWEKVKHLAPVIHDTKWNCEHIYLFDELIEIYNGWGPSHYDFQELLGRAFNVGKFNFMSFKDVIHWKTERNMEKDKGHLELIHRFLAENTEFTSSFPLQ